MCEIKSTNTAPCINAISLWVSERGRHGGRDITFTLLVLRFLPYNAIPNTAHAAPSIDSVS